MSVEWFYTTNKQEMGPVTWKELIELAERGILKPHDMVWTEGMDDWVKAINQEGLFGAGVGASMPAKKSAYTQAKPPPGRRSGRIDDDEEDEKEARRTARKREEDRARTGVGIKVGLTLAGVLVVFLLLGCGGIALLWITFSGGAAPKQNIAPYSLNLPTRIHDQKAFDFKRNQTVTITVTNPTPNMNVQLLVFRNNENTPPLHRGQQFDRTCRADLVIPADDRYLVRVANLDPRPANGVQVTIDVR